ncbi:hypothetical protein [Phyllobacterium sp. SB3]|uniref:hypothetical protein n=1 Tax=Phyllobacterium sp. SB3 TaxID=3156073 RepID=UPI0032AEE191
MSNINKISDEAIAPSRWGSEAIGDLLDKVQKAGGTIPERYLCPKGSSPEQAGIAGDARRQLGEKISWAFFFEEFHPELTSKTPAKERYKKLNSMKKQLSMLLSPLEDDLLKSQLSARVSWRGHDLANIVEGMKALRESALDELKVFAETKSHEQKLMPNLKETPQELLLGRLGKVYREGLGLEPDIKEKGPFVAFVDASYLLAGKKKPKSGDTITKALRRAGHSKSPDNL